MEFNLAWLDDRVHLSASRGAVLGAACAFAGAYALFTRRHKVARPAAAAPAVPAPALPALSCLAWLVADGDTGRPLLGLREADSLQIASMTKITTALVVLRRCEALAAAAVQPALPVCDDAPPGEAPELSQQLARPVVVSRKAAAEQRGTNANLREGETYTVRQMLFALLLPSGNDAAVALAEHFGAGEWCGPNEAGDLPAGKYYAGGHAADSPVGRFVGEMTRTARAVVGAAAAGGGSGSSTPGDPRSSSSSSSSSSKSKSKSSATCFSNPHGMSSASNLSSCADVAAVAAVAMRYATFRAIVGCERKRCVGVHGRFKARDVTWDNTNALLGWRREAATGEGGGDEGAAAEVMMYEGVKTGWVPNVGGRKVYGCLCVRASAPASVDAARRRHGGAASALLLPRKLLVVVVGARNQAMRFVDTHSLTTWAWNTLQHMHATGGGAAAAAGEEWHACD